jgi:hypothetical protein
LRIAFSAAIVVGLLAWNAQSIARAGVHGYQHAVAPVMTRIGVRCRFTPSCSRYAEAVIARDGVMRGGWKSLKRIARCNPLTAMGTVDVP